MKILIISQYYFPEPFRITDICEELVKRGHTVDVVTGVPNYPMGEIYEGYRKGKKRDEIRNGVNIHRCFTIGRRQGAFYRFLNYYSYAFSSASYVKRLANDYDVVFVNEVSPVMMAKAGIVYQKKYHKRLVIYCLDLWPACLAVGGIKRGSLLYRYYHHVSKKIYSQADKLLISSQSFASYFKKEFNITDTEYLPQYAESLFSPEQCKKEPNGMIDLMFAGNIGVAQSVETILQAAALIKDVPNLRWHIVGDGSELEHCKQLAHRLHLDDGTVTFYGRKPLEEMPKYYAMADAMLVTMQKDPIVSMTLPGKVQTYMAAGKPMIGAIDGETRKIIEEAKCGLCCAAEDVEALVHCIKQFVLIDDKSIMSINGIAYSNLRFKKYSFLQQLEKGLFPNSIEV